MSARLKPFRNIRPIFFQSAVVAADVRDIAFVTVVDAVAYASEPAIFVGGVVDIVAVVVVVVDDGTFAHETCHSPPTSIRHHRL